MRFHLLPAAIWMRRVGGAGARKGVHSARLDKVQTRYRQGTMAKFSPFKFLQEVRQEVAKVTWPSRRETTITTVMVFVFSVVAAVFFLMADQAIRQIVVFVPGIVN